MYHVDLPLLVRFRIIFFSLLSVCESGSVLGKATESPIDWLNANRMNHKNMERNTAKKQPQAISEENIEFIEISRVSIPI